VVCLRCLTISMSEITSLYLLVYRMNALLLFFSFFNSQFLSKVAENYTKDTDLIVACQKGLR
jgi:hypothetical protein